MKIVNSVLLLVVCFFIFRPNHTDFLLKMRDSTELICNFAGVRPVVSASQALITIRLQS